MKFIEDQAAPLTPESEWMARVTPFLLAADPHQACTLRAREAGSETVNAYCTCEHEAACTKECCNPSYEE